MKSKKVLNLYPIDYPFETLKNRVENKKLILDPEFQRKYKWDSDGNERASKFIESCLMRIPLPACYFAEDEYKNHMVIDGVQRITTIIRFMNDEFELEGLTAFKEINGKLFSQIGEYQSDLENYTIRCIILRNDNEKQLIQDIFARLNQGAVTLTPQEIRHAVYPGPLDDLLKELGKIDIIRNFGKTENSKVPRIGLEAEELVLRFFALHGNLNDYDNNSTKYLDRFMEKNQNSPKIEINKMRDLFIHTLENCKIVFEDKLFIGAGNKMLRQSFVYYDLLMWALQDYSHDFILTNKAKIQEAYTELCTDNNFKKSLTGKLLMRNSILRRRNMWTEKLESKISNNENQGS